MENKNNEGTHNKKKSYKNSEMKKKASMPKNTPPEKANGTNLNNTSKGNMKNVRKKKKRMSVKKKVIILISIMLATIIGFGVFMWFYIWGDIRHTKIDKGNSNLGINDSFADSVKDFGIVNIALFGVDSRAGEYKGLSDTIIVATLDKKKGKIKLISIARDSRVSIEGEGKTKINAAYSNGGATLAIKTLNQNFDLDIRDYVTINMANLKELIDAAGGVTVEISEAERIHANGIMDELDKGAPKIKKSGNVLLTGPQAVAYMRIRKLDSDIFRMGRQQKVLQALLDKALDLNPVDLAQAINTASSMVETSLSKSTILQYATILTNKNLTMESMKFPNSQTKYQASEATGWDIVYSDMNDLKNQTYNFIYRDVITE